MIELNSKTQQDFLNRKWVQRLLDAGVDMSDAKYLIGNLPFEDSPEDYVYLVTDIRDDMKNQVPTYTVSELLYKLHEYIYPTINGEEYSGGLRFFKDAPFYVFYYALTTKDYDKTKGTGKYNENYIFAECEYPIESLASLLIQCHKQDIGLPMKDVGDISGK